jgi:hypothetical protein
MQNQQTQKHARINSREENKLWQTSGYKAKQLGIKQNYSALRLMRAGAIRAGAGGGRIRAHRLR